MTPIRVGIVENHPLYLRGLVELLAEQDIVVVRTAATVPDLLEHLGGEGAQPDVVLLDRHLPAGGPQGTQAVTALVAHGLRVLVVSATHTATATEDAMAAGASGYVSKDATEDELILAIRTVVDGRGRYASPLPEDPAATRAQAASLSDREREVIRLVAAGDADAEIARKLHITTKTVHSHLDRIHAKIGIRNRRRLSLWALSVGLVELDGGQPT